MRYKRPAILQFACRPMGEGNSKALAEGLKTAAETPHLEELSLWGCHMGDVGGKAIAGALAAGCGTKLQTLLLDDNGIGARGAAALGASLTKCPELRELSMAKNPLGPGFAALVVASVPRSRRPCCSEMLTPLVQTAVT